MNNLTDPTVLIFHIFKNPLKESFILSIILRNMLIYPILSGTRWLNIQKIYFPIDYYYLSKFIIILNDMSKRYFLINELFIEQ